MDGSDMDELGDMEEFSNMDVFYLFTAQNIDKAFNNGQVEEAYTECRDALQDPFLPFYYRGQYHLMLASGHQDDSALHAIKAVEAFENMVWQSPGVPELEEYAERARTVLDNITTCARNEMPIPDDRPHSANANAVSSSTSTSTSEMWNEDNVKAQDRDKTSSAARGTNDAALRLEDLPATRSGIPASVDEMLEESHKKPAQLGNEEWETTCHVRLQLRTEDCEVAGYVVANSAAGGPVV